MERKTGSGLFVIPVLYALLILLFLYLHFSQFEDFSRQMKNVSYSGMTTTGRGSLPSKISRLTILSNGLEMKFSPRAALTMITEDNIKRELYLQEMSRNESVMTLDFKYDTSIRITSDPASNNSSIEFSIPKTVPPVKELRFHAKAYLPFQLIKDEENRYMLTDGTSSYFLNMDKAFTLDTKGDILSISMEERTSSILTLEDEAPGLGRTVREWLEEEEIISDSEYSSFIDKYKTLSYNGLKSRFDKNLGEWLIPEGKSSFDEETLVTAIVETLRRGEFALLLPDLLKAAEKHSSQLSWYSAPFTGDIVNKGTLLVRGTPRQLLAEKAILPMTGNPESSPYREIVELKNMLNSSNEADLDAWIEENLFPLLIWLEEGLFLFHPENPVSDTRMNIQAAELLITAGERTGSSRILQIGRKLMMSQLSKADETGNLPLLISFSRERASQSSGLLCSEEISALFPESAFTPRIIDLTKEVGEGSWIYTAAESVRIRSNDATLNIDLTYPKGQAHHLILKGIDPFDRILLHGIRWKSDPHFQRYSDGWVYDSVNRILYIKIRQRANRESISIQRAIEPAPSEREDNNES